ncbi:MAG: hypothetical protein JXX14_12500 [Deltaproteobacteria bacterium]|nr:hypothetical protein [Deltaproteobacteria bacterium]
MSRNYLSTGWSSAAPLWHTFEQAAGISFIGAELSYQIRVTDALSVGPDVHWQLFDAVSKTIARPNSAVINDWHEKRFLNAGVTAHYYFFKRDTMLPYLGLGIGGLRVREKRELPAPHTADSVWHISAASEIGMYILHGRIPVWFSSRLIVGIPSRKTGGEMMTFFTLGITVPN